MYISRSPNNVSFGKVYAIAGNNYQMNKLKGYFDNSTGDILYLESKKLHPTTPKPFSKSNASQGIKRIALIVVGKKDIDSINTNQKGWRTLREISRHVEKYVDLTSVKK